MNCPFIDSDNPHCNRLMTMQKLEDAFEFCLDHYEHCPLYQQLNRKPLEAVVGSANIASITDA